MSKLKRCAALAATAALMVLAALSDARPFAAAVDGGTYLVYTGGIFGRLDPAADPRIRWAVCPGAQLL